MAERPVVLISYSHDSKNHREAVLGVAERLRSDGIEVLLDQYVAGRLETTWPRWMLDSLDAANFVLLVCTETYYRRFRGHEEPGKGRGVDWEGAVITNELYEAYGRSRKFLPVLLDRAERPWIPEPLRGRDVHELTSEDRYQALYDVLLDQAGVQPGKLGELRRRPRKTGRPARFGSATTAEHASDPDASDPDTSDPDASDPDAPDSDAELAKLADQRDALSARISARLWQDPAACAALALEDEVWKDAITRGRDPLMSALWDSNPVDLIRGFFNARCRLVDRDTELAESLQASKQLDLTAARGATAVATIDFAFSRLVPQRVLRGIVYETKGLPGMLLTIPVDTDTMAELTVAGHFARQHSLEVRGDELVAGAGIQLTDDVGRQNTDVDNFRRLVLHLAASGLMRPKLFRKKRALAESGSEQELFRFCEFLNQDIPPRNARRRFRHYVLLQRSEEVDVDTLIKFIQGHLEHLDIVLCEGGDELAEQDLSGWIQAFLEETASMGDHDE